MAQRTIAVRPFARKPPWTRVTRGFHRFGLLASPEKAKVCRDKVQPRDRLPVLPVIADTVLPKALFLSTFITAATACSSDSRPPRANDESSDSTDAPSNDGNETVENPRDDSEVGATQGETASLTQETHDAPSVDTFPRDNSSNPSGSDVVWERCGPGRCTTLQVPVDYSDSSKGTLGLRLFVAEAQVAALRQGVLFFNPGGPGVPVVSDAAGYHAFLAEYFPAMDIVLMDNRGMGESEPIDCVDTSFVDTQLADNGEPWSTSTLERLATVWTRFNEGCVERMGESAIANMHSVNVARDMDRVRQLLGEEQINVWNVSYGTVQASFYAKLFPERVRAFVLDSPVYFGTADYPRDVSQAIAAYDQELSRFLSWCASGDRCGLGSTPEAVGQTYDAIRATLTDGVTYDGQPLSVSVLDAVATSLLMYGEWETLAVIVESAARGDWENLYVVASGEATDPAADHALLQSNIVVRALDYGCPADYSPAQALDDIDSVTAQHPRVAEVYAWSFSFCLGWETAASEQRLVTEDLASPPMLVVSSAHDAATPLAGAENLVTQLNNESRLLVIEKEGHGVIGADEDGTRAGIDFVRSGTLEPCSTLDCLGLGNYQLRGFRLPSTNTARRPHLRNRLSPLPVRPLLRAHR